MNEQTKPRVLIAAGIFLIVAALLSSSTLFTVHQTKQAIVLQFGALKRVVQQPGLHFKIPFIQNVRYFESRVLNLDPPVQTVVLSDQRRLRVDVFVRYRIIDPAQFVRVAISESNLQQTLGAIVNEQVRAALGGVDLQQILSEERVALTDNVREQVNQVTKQSDSNFGINVLDVRIRRADLSEEVSQAVYARMRAEREKDAAEFRANGQEEYQTITSNADRQATVIIAEAQREAQKLRGEGDAARTRTLNRAYGQDPEFFSFYRSLQAYQKSLAEDERAQFIIPPDSDFFQFFETLPESLEQAR
ncbi:MAG: protease modulator HflC [Alphaproteobacteria bacterium]|nr:protease modulator HflC [Alphaproteobacteria bacterium]MDA7983016.1 protease modulator HflC [Alphaproteobacteria bacterium]MDA7984417.1 protease modulator HflC [Alphaproteobacteria bacterium]MDA7987821.1 protease modulator HflC [Alphaproteobacteria bacterium]MDA7988626.1 protease modulator HflC [Alphaproteobacteria bacterium]